MNDFEDLEECLMNSYVGEGECIVEYIVQSNNALVEDYLMNLAIPLI